jgi:hypothetical protein
MRNIVLLAQIKLLRDTLGQVLLAIDGKDMEHVVVDLARPNVGLAEHIRRVIADTQPTKVAVQDGGRFYDPDGRIIVEYKCVEGDFDMDGAMKARARFIEEFPDYRMEGQT